MWYPSDEFELPPDQQDPDFKEDLLKVLPGWKELQELQTWELAERARVKRQFDQRHAEKLARIKSLKAAVEQAYETTVTYLQQKTMATRRRNYFGDAISTQIRSKPGEYDPDELEEWTKRTGWGLLLPTKGPLKIALLHWLRTEQPHMLLYDEERAAKEAARASKGRKQYPDSPVDLEPYVTRASRKTFDKLMVSLDIQSTVDARRSANDE